MPSRSLHQVVEMKSAGSANLRELVNGRELPEPLDPDALPAACAPARQRDLLAQVSGWESQHWMVRDQQQ